MAANFTLAPTGYHQFFDNNGDPAAGYLLFTYSTGTSTKASTYDARSAPAGQNANPIVLDSAGRAVIFMRQGEVQDWLLCPPTDSDPPTSPVWTQVGVAGVPEYVGSVDVDATGLLPALTPAGPAVYLSDGGSGLGTAGYWYPADASVFGMSRGPLQVGIVSGGVLDDNTVRVAGVWPGSYTPGATYYLSDSIPGAITATRPANNARVIGVADGNGDLHISPGNDVYGYGLKTFAFSSGQGNGAGTSGAAPTQLTSYDVTIPAGYLSAPGESLILEGLLLLAANTNVKTFHVQVGGGTVVQVLSNNANVANHVVPFRAVLKRRTATTGAIYCISYVGAATAGAPTLYMVNAVTGTVAWGSDQTLKAFASGNNADDVKLTDFSVQFLRANSSATV